MKRLIVLLVAAVSAVGVFAGPCGSGGGRGCGPCGPCGPGWHHPCGPGPCHPPHHDGWGRGGRDFWPGFVGGLVGGLACRAVAAPCPRETVVVSSPAVVTQPVVVQQPVVVSQPVVSQPVVTTSVAAPVTQTQNVWVEGRYVDTVQANGSVVRVWSPGHYETRTVVVQ